MSKFEGAAGHAADDVVERMRLLGVDMGKRGDAAEAAAPAPSPAAQTLSPEAFVCKSLPKETKSCRQIIIYKPSEKKKLDRMRERLGYSSIPQMVVGVALELASQLEEHEKKED